MQDEGLFGAGDTVFFVVFALVALVVVTVFVTIVVTAVLRWSRNSASPVQTVRATVVARRGDTWGDTSSTTYYATFELASGERLELPMRARDFGQLADGDVGQLTHQGTRFKGFARERSRTS